MEIAANSSSGLEDEQFRASEQYLSFMLDGEEYAVDILRVQGIQGFGDVTNLPNSLDYILGVINLRGDIVPIVDLRKKFGLDSIAVTSSTVVIVVKIVCQQGKEHTIGLMVDEVSEVHNVRARDLKPVPEIGCNVDGQLVKALVKVGDTMLIILEMDGMIQASEMAQLNKLTAASKE